MTFWPRSERKTRQALRAVELWCLFCAHSFFHGVGMAKSWQSRGVQKPKEKVFQIPVPDFQILDWHLDVLSKFYAERKRYVMLNCHRRSRKTTLAVNLLIKEATENPNATFGYIAPTYRQAKSIVWTDPNMLFRYLPEALIKKRNETELYVQLFNGSMIVIKGADDPDTLRGGDYKGVIFDEWSLNPTDRGWTEIVRPILSMDKERWAVFLFTPKGRNHCWQMWNACENWDDWTRFQFNVDDTKLVPPEELKQASREMPESLYRQEFFCDFVADDERTIIQWADLDKLRKHIYTNEDDRRIVGLDPSQGGDECVAICLQGGAIKDKLVIKGERDFSRICGQVLVFMGKNQTNNVAVDSIGIGAGISAMLRDAGKDVQEIISSQKALDTDRFSNLRAQMWWYAGDQIRNFKVPYPDDQKICEQLTVPRFDVNSRGKIQMETKDKTKEVLKCSPDHADAYIYGLWGLQYTLRDAVKQDLRSGKMFKKHYAGGAGGW